MVACPVQALVVLRRMLALFAKNEMIYAWATVSTFAHIPRMFLSTDFLFEKRIVLVTIDLL